MRKIITTWGFIFILLAIIAIAATGCGRESDRVSYNISKPFYNLDMIACMAVG